MFSMARGTHLGKFLFNFYSKHIKSERTTLQNSTNNLDVMRFSQKLKREGEGDPGRKAEMSVHNF